MHNAALARIALGQTAAARQTLQELLAAHHASGASADEASTLREFADAFAAAGDMPSALVLYHQERTLAAKMMAANREAALALLRDRFDREAQQRQLQQLGRESTLISAQLSNRATLQKVWAAGAGVLLLAGVLVALLYKRVRAINLSLAHNHAFLRAQSQGDPLTGLANRRGLHDAVQADGMTDEFSGGTAEQSLCGRIRVAHATVETDHQHTVGVAMDQMVEAVLAVGFQGDQRRIRFERRERREHRGTVREIAEDAPLRRIRIQRQERRREHAGVACLRGLLLHVDDFESREVIRTARQRRHLLCRSLRARTRRTRHEKSQSE